MNLKQLVYKDIYTDEDTDGTDVDMDGTYEDETLTPSTAEVPFGAMPFNSSSSSRSCGSDKAIRYFTPLLTLVVGALLSWAWSLSPSSSSATISGNSYDSLTATNFTSTERTPTVPQPQITITSPFFEHVLEWKEVPSLSNDNNTSTSNSNSGAITSYYSAAIEFCSDPNKELYGYGPVGKCVPGKAAPLIRMQPKRCVTM